MKILSIDIGGTSIKSAIATINKLGDISLEKKYSTQFDNDNPSISITHCIDKYCDEEFQYVAVAATGVISKNGVVVSTNGKINNYLNLDIKSFVQSTSGCETIVINDLTAIGYAQIDHLVKDDVALVIALGTGIGGCLIYKDSILEGASGAFAEIGQLKINGIPYEDIASTKALIQLAITKYNLTIDNGIQFFDILNDNKDAQRCFLEWTTNLATGIEQLLYCYNPNKILIAGGISEQADLIIPILNNHLSHLDATYVKTLKIEATSQRNDAGLIGAVKKLRREIC